MKDPKSVKDLAAQKSTEIKFTVPVKGHNFDKDYTLNEFIDNFSTVGFQATNLFDAINEINKMLNKEVKVKEKIIYENNTKNIVKNGYDDKTNNHKDKNLNESYEDASEDVNTNINYYNIDNSDESTETDPNINYKTKIFLGCTSNMITSGLRDTICYLAKNKFIDVFVTTAGGIEEDLIKCMGDTYLAKFDLNGHHLRDNGYNRVGNLVIPNDNYVSFEKWLKNIFDELVFETNDNKKKNIKEVCMLTPSKLIKIFGEKINDESSILYWCYKNNIPVYCPGLTDGSIGDILTFYDSRDMIKLDIVEDIYKINYEAIHQKRTGVIILGSGIIKHHILNANLFKNGADYCVLLNNASEFDGSDAGANVSEAISWGKLKGSGVKVFGDATILFPLIVASTFARQTE